MPAGSRIRLEIGAHGVEVASDDAATLAWLSEFLAPAFRSLPPEPDSATPRVDFEVDPAGHAELRRAQSAAPLRTLEGFTLDGSFSLHRGWPGGDGRTWAGDERADAFYGVDGGGRSVRVVVARAEGSQRVALMRVVRELAGVALLRDGWLPLHAAGFAFGGEATLVCGPKRAGKTSLLVHALSCGGVFLSNDRVFVSPKGPPVAQAMPTIAMLRDGTLGMFAELARAHQSARFDRGRTLAECAPGIERPEPRARPGYDHPGISPAQLCHLLGAPMRAAAPLGTLWFPSVDAGTQGVCLEALAPEHAQRALEQSLLEPSSPPRHSELFAPRAGVEGLSPELRAERCRRLLERVRVFACRLGRDAFETDLREVLRHAGLSRE